jgi:hypothetical protein
MPANSKWTGELVMSRLVCLASVFVLFGSSACQSYTTGLQKSVTRADEASAIAALRNIGSAERTYSVTNNGEYAGLKQLTEAGLLDSRFSDSRPLRDYVLTLNIDVDSFSCNADPDPSLQVQGRHLYIDSSSGVIHVNESQPATASDPALQ